MKKLFYKLLCLLFSISILFISTISILGYQRYREVKSMISMHQTIEEIKQDDSYLSLDEISPYFLSAIIAVEDPDFYSHRGIQVSRIIDAFITDLIHLEYVKGGSTITQQLAKNLFLDQDKNLTRKVAELFFVHDFENNLEKDEILELYLNIIYFGDGYYGIKEAAAGYFNKNASELTLAQASLLAGLPQAPAIYQLSDGYVLAKQRQRVVLQAMADEGYIEEEQIDIIYRIALN